MPHPWNAAQFIERIPAVMERHLRYASDLSGVGELFWLKRVVKPPRAGKSVQRLTVNDGDVCAHVKGRLVRLHRLAQSIGVRGEDARVPYPVQCNESGAAASDGIC